MQKKTKLMLGAGAFALAGAALIATASADGWRHHGGGHGMWGGGPGHGPGRLMEQLDTNQDGALSKAEVEGVRDQKLAQFDADKNGTLSLDEFQGLWLDMMRPGMVRGFQRFDEDGDGQLTGAEMLEPFDRMLARLDDNGDGTLSRDELRPPRRDGGRHGDRPGDDQDAE
jgi:hypothetical protein